MTIDATFWVMISFFVFVGLLIYFKIPQKIKTTLDENISNIKKQIDEADKLKEDSKNLNSVINLRNLSKKKFISRGDDYQILFTSNRKNRSFIKKISSTKKIKITRIGKILNSSHKCSIIDKNSRQIKINIKGYIHRFG